MTKKCPTWAERWAGRVRGKNPLCDCGARLAITVCLAKDKEGNEIEHLVCSESGWMPENCPRAHPEKVVRPLDPLKASYV